MTCYIRVEDTIPNITDQVYVMGKDIENINGNDSNEKKKHTSKRLKNEHKRETKWKSAIKKNWGNWLQGPVIRYIGENIEERAHQERGRFWGGIWENDDRTPNMP